MSNLTKINLLVHAIYSTAHMTETFLDSKDVKTDLKKKINK